ncbi:hypothetical protein KQX54_020416 [Cotesia glomerata]|uniref:Uncharacterized protein n=1 Tax=Cotesia glomerata TaxID=32391 RepID=A0AAV7J8X0_COTGL|nr:hypothetical protein KQX54_020416 [Cotesia glomerata]
MLSSTCSGTPRRQSAMSSSSLVIEQLSCSPTFRLRLLGSCTEAQGLRAEPLNSITLCSKPIHTRAIIENSFTYHITFSREALKSIINTKQYSMGIIKKPGKIFCSSLSTEDNDERRLLMKLTLGKVEENRVVEVTLQFSSGD